MEITLTPHQERIYLWLLMLPTDVLAVSPENVLLAYMELGEAFATWLRLSPERREKVLPELEESYGASELVRLAGTLPR